MENKIIKEYLLKFIDFIMNVLLAFGIVIITGLHFIVSFFPVLFLFDFYFFAGHQLFLRYVLHKKWFECIKDISIKIKYILLPYIMMELIVLLYYHKATFFIIKTIMENNN